MYVNASVSPRLLLIDSEVHKLVIFVTYGNMLRHVQSVPTSIVL